MHYAITNLAESLPDSAAARLARLRQQARRWAEAGVDFVQLREKSLDAGEVLALAQVALAAFDSFSAHHRPRLLVNGRADIARAAGADGVHLPGRMGEMTPEQVRKVFNHERCVVSVSCHSVEEVAVARRNGVDVLLFGPVFGKAVGGVPVQEGVGLKQLRAACDVAGGLPVLALGGVRWADEAACREAGAAGVAGIRLFESAVGEG